MNRFRRFHLSLGHRSRGFSLGKLTAAAVAAPLLYAGFLMSAQAATMGPVDTKTPVMKTSDVGSPDGKALGVAATDLAQGGELTHILRHANRERLLRIVAFGSSSTEGVGASSPAGAYPAQLQLDLAAAMPKLSIQVVNRGIGGEDVDDMMVRLQSDVLVRKPDLVIWQTGSNDPMRDVPLDRFDAETRAGIAAIRATGAAVMLMEPQWCPKLDATNGSGRFRDAIRQIGAELAVPVIRRTDLMHRWVAEGRISRDQMIAPDGLHMTDRGYAMLARDVATQILGATATSVPVASSVAPAVRAP